MEGVIKMEKIKGKRPDFKSDGVAVWVNKKENGEKYLSISLLGGTMKLVAWKNQPKEENDGI